MKRTLLLLALAACLLMGACASQNGGATVTAASQVARAFDSEMAEFNAYADGAAPTTMAATAAPASGTVKGAGESTEEIPAIPDDGRKLIRTGFYNLETLHYSQTIQEIEALVNSVGGYIQHSNQSGGSAQGGGYQSPRSAFYVLRVPASAFFTVGRGLEELATVIYSEHSVEEVTDVYYDTEARLSTLRVQEERLLALMADASKLEAIIELEARLAEVRYSIESYESQLRRLDSQIAYSTLTIQVKEVFEPTVIEPTPVTLGQRIASRFKSTLSGIRRGFESFVVVVLGDGLQWLINLAILALIGLVVWRVYRAVQAYRAKRSPGTPPRRRGELKPPAAPKAQAPVDDSTPPQDGEPQ